jgi:hypothetical protein
MRDVQSDITVPSRVGTLSSAGGSWGGAGGNDAGFLTIGKKCRQDPWLWQLVAAVALEAKGGGVSTD